MAGRRDGGDGEDWPLGIARGVKVCYCVGGAGDEVGAGRQGPDEGRGAYVAFRLALDEFVRGQWALVRGVRACVRGLRRCWGGNG